MIQVGTISKPKLIPLRFGEFLYEQKLLTDEQLLATLAHHWSSGGKVGQVACRLGFLTPEQVERQAAVYHGECALTGHREALGC